MGEYQIYSIKMADSSFRTYVGEQQVELDVPDNYDPRPAQVAALQAQKQKATADYHKSVKDIQDQINKLTALEFTTEEQA